MKTNLKKYIQDLTKEIYQKKSELDFKKNVCDYKSCFLLNLEISIKKNAALKTKEIETKQDLFELIVDFETKLHNIYFDIDNSDKNDYFNLFSLEYKENILLSIKNKLALIYTGYKK